VTIFEWLIPGFFGTPDLGFWGRAFHGDEMPLFYSLAPGALALALVFAAGRPRGRAAWWAWGLVAVGLFFALGRWNPILHGILSVAKADLLRFPVKLWTLVAIGGSVLCALGFERVYLEGHRRRFHLVLAGLAGFYLLCWGSLNLFSVPVGAGMRRLIPSGFPDAFVDHERVRWAGICLLSFLLVAVAALLLRLGRRRTRVAGAITLLLHLGLQLLLLRLLLSTESAELYGKRPPLLKEIPVAGSIVQGDSGALFGSVTIPVGSYPDTRVIWVQRQVWSELYPFAGMIWGRRYELNLSPEGLDSFLTRATAQAVQLLPDARRLRLLAASGVDYLVLGRALEPGLDDAVSLIHRMESVEREVHVYRLLGSADPVSFVGEVLRAPHLNAAVDLLTSAEFDPRRAVVLPEGGPALSGPGGTVGDVRPGVESIEFEVEAESAGAAVLQWTFLPIYRAEVDGEPVAIEVANMHRMAILLEPGTHQVRVWVDRVPLRTSALAALLALVAIAAIGFRLDPQPD
jgi:hypothetical protein